MKIKNVEKYTLLIRSLHWFMGIVILSLILVGFIMSDLGDEWYKLDLYKLHKTFGLIIFLLFFVRIIAKIKSNIPKYPNNFNKFYRIVSNITHKALYFFIFIVSGSGLLMSILGGYGLAIFNYKIEIPINNKELSSALNDFHGPLAYTMLFVIVLHMIGAFKRLLIDKYNIFKRIL